MVNPHEKLIQEYAKDWAKTSRPWEFWVARQKGSTQWRALDEHPIWNPDSEYCRREDKVQWQYEWADSDGQLSWSRVFLTKDEMEKAMSSNLRATQRTNSFIV